MTNDIIINSFEPIRISATKANVTTESLARQSFPHIHDTCEIYVNLSGNVSFIVEKNIYSIQRGDIIVTKPYEYHQCIYNDDSDHLHYWITFSAEENPELFDFLSERERGTENLIRLPEEMCERFIDLCERLVCGNSHPVSVIGTFFEIIGCMRAGLAEHNVTESENNFPDNINEIIKYINKNFASIKNIRDLAEIFHISITTLERYFKKYLSMTPKRYLEDKKLSYACLLLRKNASVTEACFESGFDDYSHFITIFKKNFHTTPLKYKKEYFE